MSRYLNTRGMQKLSIAICDRCKMKLPYSHLVKDGDKPGLRVHPECSDERDPYKLPARQTENFSLSYARPDAPLSPDEDL